MAKSRPDRWADAVDKATVAIEAVREALAKLEEPLGVLREVQEEYQGWLDGLPEGGSAATREKLEAVCELSLEDVFSTLEEAVNEAAGAVEEAEAADLPRGFGKD